jgi:outer membrane protein
VNPRGIINGRQFAAIVTLYGLLFGVVATPHEASAETKRLTLDDALATARRTHPGLRAKRAERNAADVQVGEAASGYLPRVDTYIQYQRTTANWMPTPWTPGLAQNAAANRGNQLGFTDTLNYVTFGAALTQPIYDFGKTGGKVDAARAQESLSEANLNTSEQDVDVAVRVAYYGVLAAEQAVQVADETHQNQLRHLEQIQQFVDAGSRTKYDLVSAKLKLEDAKLALARAQNGLRTTKVKLSNAIGLDVVDDVEVLEPSTIDASIEKQGPPELLRVAATKRPELARSAAQVAVRRADHDTARAGYLPDLVATGSFNGAKVGDIRTGLNWYVGVGLNWRVFEGLRSYHRSESAKALVSAGEADDQRLRQLVETEIQLQLIAVDEASERIGVAGLAVETAQEKLRLAEGRYAIGSGSVLELEDAQVAYSGARFQLVQARYDLAVARVLLRRAVGI